MTARASTAFTWALRRDLLLAARRRSDALNLVGFFVLACALVPLATSVAPDVLRSIGAGIVWIAALLSTMLAAPRWFEQDLVDGSLEQMACSGRSLSAIVGGKLLAAWLTGSLPLVVATPLLAVAYRLDATETGLLAASLLIGTPALQAVTALAAGLTIGLRGGATLVTLLCLPLFAPTLIFGAGTVDRWQAGLDPTAPLALLAAVMLVTLLLAPFLTALAVRISLE